MPGYRSEEAARRYRQLGLEGEVTTASPHRLIQMLFEGALSQLMRAADAFDRADIPSRGQAVSRAIDIVEALRASLDPTTGDLASQLDSLYEYCTFRLLDASRYQDKDILLEVMRLLQTLKSGWDGIAPEAKD